MLSANVNSRHKRHLDADDDDDEVSRASTPMSTAAGDRKRIQSSVYAAASPTLPTFPSRNNANRQNALKHRHQPGSIVRVKLTDFVTYTAAEFYPGPNLNMVIGPNGTGKSTIVCAICLGLGWSPALLGRAKEASEFVKHGAKEATIEIELQRRQGPGGTKRNPVIRRRIKKDENKSTYWLNDNSVTQKEVQKLMKDFNIQVDNLCQFLPQDRVVEFARMTPVEMLRTTLKAAADPDVSEYHEKLIELRQQQKDSMGDNKGDREQLENLRKRQQGQALIVERLKERMDTQKKLAHFEKCKILAAYMEARGAVSRLKRSKQDLEAEMENLQKESEPALSRVNAKKAYVERLQRRCQFLAQQASKAVSECKALEEEIKACDDKINQCDVNAEAEVKAGKVNKAQLAKHQNNLRNLEVRKQHPPAPFDAPGMNESIQQLSRELRKLNASVEDLTTSLITHKTSSAALEKDRNELQERLGALDTDKGRQDARLQAMSKVTHQAWSWIKENQNKFKCEVFGPPAVTCSVKDPAMAAAVESLLGQTDFNIFTVQCYDDFRTFQQELSINQKLSGLSFRTCSREASDFEKPLSDAALHSLGMESWAIDCLDGPPIVLGMLCADKSLHQIGLSSRTISSEQHERIVVSELKSYVAGKKAARFTRRAEYGAAGVSARIYDIRDAQVWTDKPIDAQARSGLTRQIQEKTLQQHEEREAVSGLQSRINRLKADIEIKSQKAAALKEDKETKQKALTEWNGLDAKIESIKTAMTAVRDKLSTASQRRKDNREMRDDAVFDRADKVVGYCEAIHALNMAQSDSLGAEVALLAGRSDWENLDLLNTNINNLLKDKGEKFQVVKNEHEKNIVAAKKLKDEISDLKKEGEELAQDGDESLNNLISELSSDKELVVRTIDEKIEALQSRLDLITGDVADANTITEFEARAAKIAKLEERVSYHEDEQGEFLANITLIRNSFENDLEPIISKIDQAFGESFARIGCAGQVTIHKASSKDPAECTEATGGIENGLEFEDWAIHIHVKFRENEPLSLLDSHRQSGGERAVSTIFYLMALQSLSKSPFRVVDEINQGMDPRNERMVHGRMVDIAAANERLVAEGKSSGSQYFLITPKLLSGLKYERGMTVLCIVSGEHMPNATDIKRQDENGREYIDKGKKIDFGAFARKARALGYNDTLTLSSHGNDSGNGNDRLFTRDTPILA